MSTISLSGCGRESFEVADCRLVDAAVSTGSSSVAGGTDCRAVSVATLGTDRGEVLICCETAVRGNETDALLITSLIGISGRALSTTGCIVVSTSFVDSAKSASATGVRFFDADVSSVAIITR